MSINRLCGRPIARHVLVVILLLVGTSFRSLTADDARLTERQSELANRYQQLEELLLRLAEVEAAENPERSALLRRAARQSSDKFVLEKMRSASDSLKTQEFQKAVDNQTAARQELAALLKLLMSEDRSKRIRDEKERLSNIAKAIKRTLRAQQSTRARTENGAELDQVQPEQESIGDRAEKLADQLAEENESESGEESPSPSESSPQSESSQSDPSKAQEDSRGDAEPKAGDDQSAPQKPGEKEPGEKKPGEKESGEKMPGEKKPGEKKPGEKESGEKMRR